MGKIAFKFVALVVATIGVLTGLALLLTAIDASG
jgi:hypothetical protein